MPYPSPTPLLPLSYPSPTPLLPFSYREKITQHDVVPALQKHDKNHTSRGAGTQNLAKDSRFDTNDTQKIETKHTNAAKRNTTSFPHPGNLQKTHTPRGAGTQNGAHDGTF